MRKPRTSPKRRTGHEVLSAGADPGAGVAAPERTSLVLGQAAPYAVVLTGLESPGEALLAYVAATAHLFGFLDLHDRGCGVADGEEQFRVLIEANGPVSPIHGGFLSVGGE